MHILGMNAIRIRPGASKAETSTVTLETIQRRLQETLKSFDEVVIVTIALKENRSMYVNK